jgi:hypothetical protein
MARLQTAAGAARRSTSHASVEDLVVQADPDKLFFISMLVKDIELVPAVLDLVDNSVDGARALILAREGDAPAPSDADGDKPFAGMTISIIAAADRFEIADNCGGIDLDVARHYAFRFGRPKEYKGVAGSVGEFGVGMKRALFKLGREFEVASRTTTTEFDLKVDVDLWANEPGPEWTFNLASARTGLKPPAAKDLGTTIVVTRLHGTVAEDFANPLVIGQLREQLRLRHQGAIQRGLVVTLNGDRLSGLQPQLLSGPDFHPFNRSVVLNEPAGNISVQVVAGIAASEGKRDAARDEGQATDFRSAGDAGWWLFCNDRLLLYADRTSLTGWGDAGAAYHPQYRRFRGYVYLTAANTALLPWNTTKTGIDADSRVWRQVRTLMTSALVEVQAVINRLKNEREEADSPQEAPVTAALAAAVPTSVRELPPQHNVVVPAAPVNRRQPRTHQKLQFSVERDRYEAVAEALDLTTTAEVGRRVFDYFYDREIDS